MAENDQNMWVAVLGDQIGSRVVNRRDVDLIATRRRVSEINACMSDHLVVPFSISRGDEIQALTRDPMSAWKLVEAFDTHSRVNSFRFTIGSGPLSSPLTDSTWDMDGPCFHAARDEMETAKRKKRWVAFRGLGEEIDPIANGLARSLQVIREGWTKRQREAYAARQEHPLQTVAAADMGLDQSTMSKMLKAAHYKSHLEIEAALLDLLGMAWRNGAEDGGERA